MAGDCEIGHEGATAADRPDRECLRSISSTLRVKAIGGHSLGTIITKECKAIGVDVGDYIKVTIERMD